MRRVLAVLALVLVAALHTPADAAAAVQRVGLRLDYDGTGSGVYTISGVIKTDAKHPALLASVAASGKDAFFPNVVELGKDGVSTTYGAEGSHSLCPAPAVCTVSRDGGSLGFSFSYNVAGDGVHAYRSTDYLVLQGAEVTFAHAGLGPWTLHRFSAWTRVLDTQAALAGARTQGLDAEVDTDVSAVGGPHGSVAIGVPPCEGVGAGAATFTGADTGTQAALCPTSAVAGLATRRTTWQLSGALAGVSSLRTRLLVLPR